MLMIAQWLRVGGKLSKQRLIFAQFPTNAQPLSDHQHCQFLSAAFSTHPHLVKARDLYYQHQPELVTERVGVVSVTRQRLKGKIYLVVERAEQVEAVESLCTSRWFASAVVFPSCVLLCKSHDRAPVLRCNSKDRVTSHCTDRGFEMSARAALCRMLSSASHSATKEVTARRATDPGVWSLCGSSRN